MTLKTTAGGAPVRVGLIGCGAMGGMHMSAMEHLGEQWVTVAGLCDLDAERLAAAGQRFPAARRALDAAHLLAPKDLDLVILCTMPSTHAELAMAAFEAGAHVLVEKPMALDAAEAQRILDAAATAGRQVQLGTNTRYMPHCQYLKRLVADGACGEPLQCRVWASHRNPPWWGPHYRKAVSGGGILASTLVHPLDLALWVCGSPQPLSVSAWAHRIFPTKRGPLATPPVRAAYDVEDMFGAHVRFAGGLSMLIDGNWCDDTGDRHGFELAGTRGTVRSAPFEVCLEAEDGTVSCETPRLEGTDFARRRRWHMTEQAGPGAPPEADEDVLAGWGRSVEEQDAEIVEHIRAQRPWTMHDRKQLLTLQRLIDACYASAASGREVRLD